MFLALCWICWIWDLILGLKQTNLNLLRFRFGKGLCHVLGDNNVRRESFWKWATVLYRERNRRVQGSMKSEDGTEGRWIKILWFLSNKTLPLRWNEKAKLIKSVDWIYCLGIHNPLNEAINKIWQFVWRLSIITDSFSHNLVLISLNKPKMKTSSCLVSWFIQCIVIGSYKTTLMSVLLTIFLMKLYSRKLFSFLGDGWIIIVLLVFEKSIYNISHLQIGESSALPLNF